MVTHLNILAWKTPRVEETGGLMSMGSQSVGHHLVTEQEHWLDYNVVLITAQQSDSVIHTYTHSFVDSFLLQFIIGY